MLHRLLRLTTSAIVLTMLIGGTAALSASSRDDDDDDDDIRRLEVVAPEIDRVTIDLGQSGASKGDQILIRKNLFFKSDRSKQVGENAISCTIMDVLGPQKFLTMCTVVNWFVGVGQIMGQELIELDLANPGQFDMAITGGTGKFRSASGIVRILRTTGDHHLTFLLDD